MCAKVCQSTFPVLSFTSILFLSNKGTIENKLFLLRSMDFHLSFGRTVEVCSFLLPYTLCTACSVTTAKVVRDNAVMSLELTDRMHPVGQIFSMVSRCELLLIAILLGC